LPGDGPGLELTVVLDQFRVPSGGPLTIDERTSGEAFPDRRQFIGVQGIGKTKDHVRLSNGNGVR
jgi:hypothetical protein